MNNIIMGSNVSITQSNGKVIVNNVEYDLPNKSKASSVTVVNGKVYINGYELVNGKWKRTLTALWHLLF